jgi:hypothetical protein
MSRWRESSGRSFRLADRTAGESSCGTTARAGRDSRSRPFVALAAFEALADERAAVDGRERHVSPPTWIECSGFRACTSNSRGAFATCSSTKSGSSLTDRRRPLARLRERVDGLAGRNSIPSSETMRRQPPSSVATASSERIS